MGLRKRSPEGTVAREHTTTGVVLKQLNNRKWHKCQEIELCDHHHVTKCDHAYLNYMCICGWSAID